jgi:hypothetical protein
VRSAKRPLILLLTTGIRLFAECQMFCRVYFFRALDKKLFVECQTKKLSVKENTQQRISLSSVIFLTLGKEPLCRQRASLPSVFLTLGKDNLKITF